MTLQDEIRLLLQAPMMNTHDVRTQLRLDHDELLQVARDMVDADGGESRRTLLRRLRPELLVHLRAVQQEVYAVLLKVRVPAIQEQVAERSADHQALMKMLAWLAKSRKTESAEWASRAQSLLTLLRSHVEAEQDELFALMGDQFDDDALASMSQSFLNEKAQLATMDAKDVALPMAAEPVSAPRSSSRARRSGHVIIDDYANTEHSLRA